MRQPPPMSSQIYSTDKNSLCDACHIRCLRSLCTLSHIELDLIAVLSLLESIHIQCGTLYEYIVALCI